jgi:hypothetical protein
LLSWKIYTYWILIFAYVLLATVQFTVVGRHSTKFDNEKNLKPSVVLFCGTSFGKEIVLTREMFKSRISSSVHAQFVVSHWQLASTWKIWIFTTPMTGIVTDVSLTCGIGVICDWDLWSLISIFSNFPCPHLVLFDLLPFGRL